jgi:UDP-N-acetylglucosamine 2-epimerase
VSWWLPLVYGAAGYVVATVVHTILMHRSAPRSHQRYRETILMALHRRLNLEAEIADIDQELCELWQKAPDQQARLIVTNVERARTVAPALLRLAKRFGFDVPDEAIVNRDIKPANVIVHEAASVVHETPPDVQESDRPFNAWGAPAERNSNGTSAN